MCKLLSLLTSQYLTFKYIFRVLMKISLNLEALRLNQKLNLIFISDLLRSTLIDHVTQIFMVLYHKYNAQMKIYQYCTFQKALFVKILLNLHFM